MNVVSLFSGAGGLDLGFIRQGFNVICAFDNDLSSCKTYEYNIGSHVVCADVKDILKVPECDMVIGGSPCQALSQSNRNDKTPYLEREKNQLVKEYIRLVKLANPKIFVLENVPQLITVENGAFIKEIMSELSGYEITYGILNSADFGVPQVRLRAIVIGSKVGKIELPKPTVSTYKTVREAFAEIDENIPNYLDYSHARKDTLQCIRYVKQGGNFEDIPLEIRPKGNHSSKYRRLYWDKPSITVTNVRKAVIIHPDEDRVLSVAECKALQTFPYEFKFLGGLNSKQQQVANAVPVLLAEEIAKAIRKVIGDGV